MNTFQRFLIAVLMLGAVAAQAKLCEKCKGMMFIMSIGKCGACAGHTSSGSHKFCRKCGEKKNVCHACGKAMGGAKKPAVADVSGLIKQLGDKDHTKRRAATKKLIEIGEPARKALKKASQGEDPEIAARAKSVLEAMHANTAEGTAKRHLMGIMSLDFKALAITYAPEVTLMAGHEFLKDKHGLAGEKGRAANAVAKREKLIEAIKKMSANERPRSPERIQKMMKEVKFEKLKIKPGDNAVDPPDPVNTPDKKLHFNVKKGDEIIKVSPPRGDFALLHLRQIDGKWRIVAEHVD